MKPEHFGRNLAKKSRTNRDLKWDENFYVFWIGTKCFVHSGQNRTKLKTLVEMTLKLGFLNKKAIALIFRPLLNNRIVGMQTARCLPWQATCCLCIFFSKKSGLPILNIYIYINKLKRARLGFSLQWPKSARLWTQDSRLYLAFFFIYLKVKYNFF